MYGIPDSRVQEIFACGIRNTAQGIRNPTDKESGISTLNPKCTARNPESKTVLDSLTWRMGGGGGDEGGKRGGGGGGDACSFFVPVSLTYSD